MVTKRRRTLPFAEKRKKRWQVLRTVIRNIDHIRRELEWHEVVALLAALRSPSKWIKLLSVAKWIHRTHKARRRA